MSVSPSSLPWRCSSFALLVCGFSAAVRSPDPSLNPRQARDLHLHVGRRKCSFCILHRRRDPSSLTLVQYWLLSSLVSIPFRCSVILLSFRFFVFSMVVVVVVFPGFSTRASTMRERERKRRRGTRHHRRGQHRALKKKRGWALYGSPQG